MKSTKNYYRIYKFVFPGNKPDPKLSAKLKKKFRNAIRFEKKLREDYEFACRTGGKKSISDLKWRYLKSKKVWLANTLEANSRIKFDQRSGAVRCASIAETLNTKDLPPDEVVTAYLKPKASGGVRPIFRFGLKYRTCQLMVSRVLRPHIKERSWQHDLKGPISAIKAIKTDLENGFNHPIRLDIKSFFGSHAGKEIPKILPVFKSLVAETSVSRSLKAKIEGTVGGHSLHKGSQAYPNGLFRRGIPQGAISSPTIAAYITSKLIIAVPDNVKMYSYVDDYLIIGKKKSDAKKFAKNLRLAIANLPGGDFHLRNKAPLVTTDNLVFLGYEFVTESEKVVLRIPHTTMIQMMKVISACGDSVAKYLVSSSKIPLNKKHVEAQFATIWKTFEGWREYYTHAENYDDIFDMLLYSMSEHFETFHYSVKDVKSLAKLHYGRMKITASSSLSVS